MYRSTVYMRRRQTNRSTDKQIAPPPKTGPAMALRQLYASGLCMCLLLTVASAAGLSPQPLPPGFHGRDPDDCSRTITAVPSWCAGEFISALLSGNKDSPITEYCCLLLACVGESSCASALRGVCKPPEADRPCLTHQGGHVVHDRHRALGTLP